MMGFKVEQGNDSLNDLECFSVQWWDLKSDSMSGYVLKSTSFSVQWWDLKSLIRSRAAKSIAVLVSNDGI